MSDQLVDSFIKTLCLENQELLVKAGENCQHIYERLPQLYKETLDHHSLPHFIVTDLFLAYVQSGMYIERNSQQYYQPQSSLGVYREEPSVQESITEFNPQGSVTTKDDRLSLPSFYQKTVYQASQLEDTPTPQDLDAPTLQASVIASIGLTFGQLLESERPMVWGAYTPENTLQQIYLSRSETENSTNNTVMPVTIIDSPAEHPLVDEEFRTY